LTGLVRYFVLFVIDLRTRRVQVAGIADQPSAAWMVQIARNVTDGVDGFLRDCRYLILDRDPMFTKQLVETLKAAGVKDSQAAGEKSGSERVRGTMGAVVQAGVSAPFGPAR
jgi:hypothetical protein